MVEVAHIGCGYWGPNLVRNFMSLKGVHLAAVCDRDPTRLAYINGCYPEVATCSDLANVLDRPEIDAVSLATPAATHYELGMQCLEAGKHLFVEKPLALSVAHCEELIGAADCRGLTLMVGHVFRYNGAVNKVKQYIDAGDLGEIYYVYSRRVNLGRVQTDINAMWSFAPHDLSILMYWLDAEPTHVLARGFSFLNGGTHDVVFMTLQFPNNAGAHVHVSWLDPKKTREMVVVGSEKMIVFDDTSVDAKVQIYDKKVCRKRNTTPDDSVGSFREFQFATVSGDCLIPSFRYDEPLQVECRHFIECVENGTPCLTSGRDGLRVVRVLETAERSLAENGSRLEIAASPVMLPPLPTGARSQINA